MNATITKNIKTNPAYVRTYGDEGELVMNKRGSAIRRMIAVVDAQKPTFHSSKNRKNLLKAHRVYLRKNRGGVSYIRFVELVTAFRSIQDISVRDKILDFLDKRPDATYTSCIAVAVSYHQFEVSNKVLKDAIEKMV